MRERTVEGLVRSHLDCWRRWGLLVSAMNRLGEGSHRCVEDDMV